ncbi:MAG: protein-ADP-ribose hydrolase [Clostridiales bacterium]|nr:protein-ADP-ribose hydrolase [Clostridiales bacterium]
MDQKESRIWLIEKLKAEFPGYRRIPTPDDEQGQKDLLRALMNMRMPRPISDEFLEVQDVYLKRENILRGITDEAQLEPCSIDPRLYLWQGDITTLKVDAIVNAANSGMTGCYQPLHNCIDNCIHSAAGIRLRLECARIMDKQGYEEPTGRAKITPGYCLPARYVIHTVGPIVNGELTDEHRELLKSSYRSCLKIAVENKLESIAFCCISTGVFMFPGEEASRIAVQTVREFLDKQDAAIAETASYLRNTDGSTPYRGVRRVIFNVFSDRDRMLYERILEK